MRVPSIGDLRHMTKNVAGWHVSDQVNCEPGRRREGTWPVIARSMTVCASRPVKSKTPVVLLKNVLRSITSHRSSSATASRMDYISTTDPDWDSGAHVNVSHGAPLVHAIRSADSATSSTAPEY